MEAPRAAARSDAAPLLQAAASSSEDVGDQPSTSGSQAAGQQQKRMGFSLLGWLAGRKSQSAERVSGTDEDSELQAQPAPRIAVIAEAPADIEAGVAAAAAVASGSGRQQGDDEIEPRRSGSPRLTRMPSRGPPTCLVCLEEFTQEEFVNGSALRLECNCRGDLALRHRECVMKWVQVKGSNVCELCKTEIRNIPAPPPRPTEADLPPLDETYFNDPNHIRDFMPSSQDLVFDCIRVTWVAMIVSILFFEMDLGAALWTGLLAGCAYSLMVRIMYRQHFYAMRRLAEQQAALRREPEGGGGSPTAAQAGGGAPAPLPVVVAV